MPGGAKLKNTRDLTRGNCAGVLCVYALPMLISMFFQQAYNLVDSYIAGNYIGTDALGAVGTCYPVTVLLLAIASGMSLGTSIHCSQDFGAGDYGRLRLCATSSLAVYLPFALLFSAAAMFAVDLAMRLLNVPAELTGVTGAYLRIYIGGFVFQFLYNTANGVLTGVGNSRLPLVFLIVSSVCNIALDLLFVAVLGMGIRGLAWATVISQAAAALLAAAMMLRVIGQIKEEKRIFSPEIMREVLALGIPSTIQHVFMSLGQLALQGVINSYGAVVMAGYSVAFRINGIVINSLMALSNAVSGFIAQNKGAGKTERIRRGLKISLAMAEGFAALSVALLLVFGRGILGVFMGDAAGKSAVTDVGMSFFRVVSPFYLLVSIKIICDGGLRGLGAMKEFMLATVTDNVYRVLTGALFSSLWGLTGVWAVWPTAWLIGTAISFFALLYHMKKLGKPAICN